MQFFYWNNSFEVGIREIDDQHKGLVDLINALATVIVEGGSLPDAQELFGRLTEYAKNHFSSEEKIMATCLIEEEEKMRHRDTHRRFVDKAQEIVQRQDLIQAEVAEQILEFLTTWLISHILGSDMKIAHALAQPALETECVNHQQFIEISSVERVLLAALTETERRFRLIADHTSVLIWVSDTSGNRGYFNRAWCDFVGISESTTQKIDWIEYIHSEDREAYLAKINAMLTYHQPVETEYRLRHIDGYYHWILERIRPRMDYNKEVLGLVAAATDISGIKYAEMLVAQSHDELEKQVADRTEQLEQLMLTDHLTGVGNRRQLTNHLKEEVLRAQRYQRPLSVIFFDIDHFKRVNDAYGHAIGDVALVEVAKNLGFGLRDCDLLCRYGGEEFIVMLPETKAAKALKVAERMRKNISLITIPQIPEGITISAGLAELMPDESDEQFLVRCDRALYRAKENGRNRCCLDTQ